MAISYFAKDFKEGYILNNIKTHNIDKDMILAVTDYGSWVVLDKKEYELVKSKKIKPNSRLFDILKEDGIILTKQNIPNVIEDYRKKCSFLFQGTSLHIIVPTIRCNQSCLYCHALAKPMNAKGGDMSEETARGVVDFIFQTTSPVVKIEFQGGEPLINFNMVKYIIRYAKNVNKEFKKQLNFAISTNLTLMDNDILDYLIKDKVSITTSLDGPKEVHDKNRGSGSYDNVVRWIKIIKRRYKIEAIPVITKYSLPYWKEVIDEYIKLGLNFVWVQPIRKIGYASKNWHKVGYSAEEFLKFWKNSLDYIIQLNKEGKKLKEILTTIILKKILKESAINFCCLQSPCGAAIGQLAYNEKGSIYCCDDARQETMFKLGDVKNSYDEIMTSQKTLGLVSASINDSFLCDNCVWKPYCGVCPVSSYADQMNIITKLPLSDRCKIYKGVFEYIFKKMLLEKDAKEIFFEWIKTPGIT